MEAVQRPLSSVGLGVSASSFNLCRHQLPILAVRDAPARCTSRAEASRRQPGFQEAGISQMKLSDTGYLSLWFWMSSVWRTAASQQLRSSCPACLSQNTPHSFFNLFSYSRLLLKRVLVIIALGNFSTNLCLLRMMPGWIV